MLFESMPKEEGIKLLFLISLICIHTTDVHA